MIDLRKLALLAVSFATLAACDKTSPSAHDTGADEAAVRAAGTARDKAYNAGDGAAVAAFYAEDAVLNAPGTPALRGKAAISEYYAKDVPAFATAGLATVEPPTSDVGVSGDLAWQWGTYKITDKSGATLDAGKYLTIFQRNDEKWMIIRDTWNSDAAPATAPVSATPPK
jgi:uncharacterized protein (TIGR02246 family)